MYQSNGNLPLQRNQYNSKTNLGVVYFTQYLDNSIPYSWKGKYNCRPQIKETEWTLDTEIFDNMLIGFSVKPDIDLFASRINYKCKKCHINLTREHMHMHNPEGFLLLCFPPFLHHSERIEKSNSKPGHWHPSGPSLAHTTMVALTYTLIAPTFLFPRRKDTLYLASKREEHHPLHKTLTLLECHLSGDSLLVKDFQRHPPRVEGGHSETVCVVCSVMKCNNVVNCNYTCRKL